MVPGNDQLPSASLTVAQPSVIWLTHSLSAWRHLVTGAGTTASDGQPGRTGRQPASGHRRDTGSARHCRQADNRRHQPLPRGSTRPGSGRSPCCGLRVLLRERGGGIGSALFPAAEDWARARGCRWPKIETQNVNVPACRVYHQMCCTLGAIDRFAYPGKPAEVQLSWWKALASPDMKSS